MALRTYCCRRGFRQERARPSLRDTLLRCSKIVFTLWLGVQSGRQRVRAAPSQARGLRRYEAHGNILKVGRCANAFAASGTPKLRRRTEFFRKRDGWTATRFGLEVHAHASLFVADTNPKPRQPSVSQCAPTARR